MYLLYVILQYILLAFTYSSDTILSSSHLVENISGAQTQVQLSFINSTSQIISLTFHHHASSLFFICPLSIVTINSCILNLFYFGNTSSFPFYNHGRVVLAHIEICQNVLRKSLIRCDVPKFLKVYKLSVLGNLEVRTSSFRDILFEGGPIISCGSKHLEIISRCEF